MRTRHQRRLHSACCGVEQRGYRSSGKPKVGNRQRRAFQDSIHQIGLDKAECWFWIQRNGKTTSASGARQGADEHGGRVEAKRESRRRRADQKKLSAVGAPGVGLGLGISKVVVELFWVRVAVG